MSECILDNKKRERSDNWTKDEKMYLVECVRERKDIIECKTNDNRVHREKRQAWLEIETLMRTNGFDRTLDRIKEQWRRLKCTSRNRFHKALKTVEHGTNSDEPRTEDWVIQEMCAEDFEPEALLATPPPLKRKKSDISELKSEDEILKLQIEKLNTEIKNQNALHELEIELLHLKKRKELLEIKILEQKLNPK